MQHSVNVEECMSSCAKHRVSLVVWPLDPYSFFLLIVSLPIIQFRLLTDFVLLYYKRTFARYGRKCLHRPH